MNRPASSMTTLLRKFFADNPDEELTYPMLMAKFDCTYDAAHNAVKVLARHGEIESVHVIRTRAKGQGK